jgi:hypothetical protein
VEFCGSFIILLEGYRSYTGCVFKVKCLMHATSKTSQCQALLKMTASRFPWTYAINPAITRTTVQFTDNGLSRAKLTLWDERIRGNELSLPKMDTQESNQQHQQEWNLYQTEHQKFQRHSRTALSITNNRCDFPKTIG